MSGVRGVLNYAGCFAKAVGSVDRVNGWEAGLCWRGELQWVKCHFLLGAPVSSHSLKDVPV